MYVHRYMERLYFFSTEEAKNVFAANPTKFVAPSGIIQVCTYTNCYSAISFIIIPLWILYTGMLNAGTSHTTASTWATSFW